MKPEGLPHDDRPSHRGGSSGGTAGQAVVYVLRCGRDGSLYTGWTNDLERRLRLHQEGRGARYTRSRLPVELAAVIPMPDASAARREEARVKRLPRRAKLALVAAHPPARHEAT